jgi:hypothetical protein
MKAILAMLALVMLGAPAAMAQPMPIPPPQAEFGPPPPPPGAAFVLEPGHWQWNGFRYVWVGRHWIHRGRGYTHFVPGHWANGPYGPPHWVPEHWGH